LGYLVGTDEAGYGPNLGPLVVSITVWQAPGDPCNVDLYKLLNKAVAAQPAPAVVRAKKAVGDKSSTRVAALRMPRKVAIADSKILYKAGEGLAALETGLLAALELCGRRPCTWREAWQTLDRRSAETLDRHPWHLDYEASLPIHADRQHIDRLSQRLRTVAEQAQVRLAAVRSKAVFPEDWNQLLEEHGNKSTVLSVLTLRLLAEALAEIGDEPVAVICDKHGGRNAYQSLLQQHATDYLVEVHGEGAEESLYRWGPAERRTEVRFCTKAERFLPTALASMASKYLRELAMLAFNDFWSRNVPGLKPTAGYPLDASRFKADIAAVQSGLAIDDRVLWRNR
jgi:hypothetical protein